MDTDAARNCFQRVSFLRPRGLKNGVVDKGPIIKNYGASIIRCHEVCAPMIQGFRGNMPDALARSYWDDFDWLADEARKEFGHGSVEQSSGDNRRS